MITKNTFIFYDYQNFRWFIFRFCI